MIPCALFAFQFAVLVGTGSRSWSVRLDSSDSFTRGVFALTRTKFSLNSISYIRAKLSQLQRYRTSDRAGGGGESFTATAMTSPIRLQRQLRAFCARVREQSGGGFRSYGSP